ncbi:MAG: hypothetical protein DRN00_04675 [Thermoplasmata archaeon]|nr:MAG: hypothetical protein DRN00_04675 [Thermoplasmata archaeon]
MARILAIHTTGRRLGGALVRLSVLLTTSATKLHEQLGVRGKHGELPKNIFFNHVNQCEMFRVEIEPIDSLEWIYLNKRKEMIASIADSIAPGNQITIQIPVIFYVFKEVKTSANLMLNLIALCNKLNLAELRRLCHIQGCKLMLRTFIRNISLLERKNLIFILGNGKRLSRVLQGRTHASRVDRWKAIRTRTLCSN